MRDINLLPDSYRVSSGQRAHSYLIVSIIVIAAITAFWGAYQYYQLSELKAANKARQEITAQLQGDKSKNEVEKRAAFAEQLVSGRSEVSAALGELFTEAHDHGITITRITRFEAGELVVLGQGMSSQQITTFTEALQGVKGFKKLSVRFIRETEPNEYFFELQGLV